MKTILYMIYQLEQCHHKLRWASAVLFFQLKQKIKPPANAAWLTSLVSGWYLRLDEVQNSRNVGIPRMNLDTEETRETHNFYIESTRGNLKNTHQSYYSSFFFSILKIKTF